MVLIERFAASRLSTVTLSSYFLQTFNRLSQLGKSRSKLTRGIKSPYALAISGGIDSTALAFFYVTALKTYGLDARSIGSRAFVVDHGGETHSAAEARQTADYLESKFDLPASVLTIEVEPGNHYETRARNQRYQAIGQACLEHKLPTILAGHHFDDVIETFFIRMLGRHKRDHLLGPHPFATFPVNNVGLGINDDFRRTVYGPQGIYSQMAECGIHVMRPLLGFSKENLRFLCTENNLEWIEDETNKDLQLTDRNAIRHMLSQSSKLPKALHRDALAQTVATVQAHTEEVVKLTEELVRFLPEPTLDLRSGLIVQRFPRLKEQENGQGHHGDPLLTENSQTKFLVLERYLRRLTHAVTPSEGSGLPVTGMTELVEKLAASFYDDLASFETNLAEPINLVIGPMRAQLIKKVSTTGNPPEVILWCFATGTHPTGTIEVPPRQSEPQTILWDGLWWITIQNRSNARLEIRTLGTKSYNTFAELLPTKNFKFTELKGTFKEPGLRVTRSGLPVIAVARPENKDLKVSDEKRLRSIIAFPTLGWLNTNWFSNLDIEIRYKHVVDSECYDIVEMPPMRGISPQYLETTAPSDLPETTVGAGEVWGDLESSERSFEPPKNDCESPEIELE